MNETDNHPERILAFIQHYQQEHRKSPTYREIGRAVGICSTDHVARDLRHLIKGGQIAMFPQSPRSIVLLTPRAPEPKAKPKPAAAPKFNGHCINCGILSRTRLCEDCKTGAPFIVYDAE